MEQVGEWMFMILGGEDRDNSNSNHKDEGHGQNWSLTWETVPSSLDALSDLISPLHSIVHPMPLHLPRFS